jgi:hypothetical protein
MDAINGGQKISPAALEEVAAAPTTEMAEEIAARALAGEEAASVPEPDKVYTDGLGKPVHDPRYQAVFADRSEFKSVLRDLKALEQRIKRLVGDPGGAFIHVENFAPLKGMKTELTERCPFSLCVTCRGDRVLNDKGLEVECSTCHGLGWIDKFRYDRMMKKKS